MHFLVTAGPTREYIDTVRFISNSASGITGYQVAAVAARAGHRVTLVSGPVGLDGPACVERIKVVSADEMCRACLKAFPGIDVLVMTAAVCDYRPKRRGAFKLKKTAPQLSLPMVRTTDILAELGRRKHPGQVLIGFALEDRRAKQSAKAKLVAKNLDAIVLNSPSALGSTRNKVSVYYGGRWHDWPVMTKRALAGRIVRLAQRLARADQ